MQAKSITHRLGASFLAVAVLFIALACFFVYQSFVQHVERQKTADLSMYVAERSRAEREIFQAFQSQAQLAIAEVKTGLAGEGPDAAATFDRWFVDNHDGTRRSVIGLLDGDPHVDGGRLHNVAGFIGRSHELTTADKRVLLAATRVVGLFGAANLNRIDNFWFVAPKSRLVAFGSERRGRMSFYRTTMPAATDLDSLNVGKLTAPANDPTGKPLCTAPEPLTYKLNGVHPLVTQCLQPAYLDGRYIGSFGETLFLNTYLDQIVRRTPPGAQSLIVTDLGQVIKETGSTAPLVTASELGPILAKIRAGRETTGVLQTSDRRALVAYGVLSEPHWILLVSFPMTSVQDAALDAMSPILACGLLAIIGQLAVLFWIVRRLVLKPITLIGRQKRDEAASPELEQIAARDDEIGQLARSLGEERRLNREILDQLEDRVRERTQALVRANHAKSAFLANMSHELRTPLNGVVALSRILMQEQISERGRQAAGLVVASGRLLEQVLSDVLDFSKIEANQLTIKAEPFDLIDCVARIGALHSSAAKAKGLAFELDIDASARGWRLGDELRITQILSNLLSNAVKFTEHGSVRLVVTRDGDRDIFKVEDTGVGFAPEFRDRMFRRFEQEDLSHNRRFGGTGLGLAISANLTELMGGTIDADSTLGEGSVFVFSLPLPMAAPPAAADGVDGVADTDVGVRALSVLVAEDHPTNRKVVELILAPLGVELTMVENGREAVEALDRRSYDIVLMDIQMPVLDGLAATREIRHREAAQGRPRVTIVALTANAMPEHVAESREAGMDGHLSKPISADALIRLLQSPPSALAKSAA